MEQTRQTPQHVKQTIDIPISRPNEKFVDMPVLSNGTETISDLASISIKQVKRIPSKGGISGRQERQIHDVMCSLFGGCITELPQLVQQITARQALTISNTSNMTINTSTKVDGLISRWACLEQSTYDELLLRFNCPHLMRNIANYIDEHFPDRKWISAIWSYQKQSGGYPRDFRRYRTE